jgi:hypothetical protein
MALLSQKIPGIQTVLVTDLTPQLGADLDANGFDVLMADKTVSRPLFLDVSEALNALGTLTGGTQDIDIELGNVVSATISTGAQTFTFSNPAVSGSNGKFELYLTNGGEQVITWPLSVDWKAATAPTLTAAGLDVLVFSTNDGGITWIGFVAILDAQ